MPELYLLIIFSAVFTPSLLLLLVLLSLFGWMGLSDYVRAEFLRNRQLDYVRAARALGVGGVALDLSGLQLAQVEVELNALEDDFSAIEKIVFANASLTERLENTGILTEGIAWDHAVIGVVGRASGIDRDLRRDRPFAAYDVLQPKVALYRYGDVRARMRVRLDEIHESIRLIREVRRGLPLGRLVTRPMHEAQPGVWALSAVEGWRGEILYVVMAGDAGRIHRCKVRDPSFVNWPAIQWAALGNIVPDFPLINKSFNLSYAGNDL